MLSSVPPGGCPAGYVVQTYPAYGGRPADSGCFRVESDVVTVRAVPIAPPVPVAPRVKRNWGGFWQNLFGGAAAAGAWTYAIRRSGGADRPGGTGVTPGDSYFQATPEPVPFYKTPAGMLAIGAAAALAVYAATRRKRGRK